MNHGKIIKLSNIKEDSKFNKKKFFKAYKSIVTDL